MAISCFTGVEPENCSNTFKAVASIRYIRGLTESIIQKIKSFNKDLILSASPERSLNDFFSKLKDEIPQELRSQLIYKLPCSMCELIYLGLTWRQYLEERLKQHKRQQAKVLSGGHITSKTAVTDHVDKHQHLFDFTRASIVDQCNSYEKLKTLEMLHICSSKYACNFRSDVASTIQHYQSLILMLKKNNLI
jgi:hypothetical protein